jgi:hypothetical protein
MQVPACIAALALLVKLSAYTAIAAQSPCQSWRPFLTGPTNDVYTMLSHDDGGGSKLYIGGDFTGFHGSTPQLFSDYIARWDGVAWRPVGPSPGFEDAVTCLAVYDSGSGPELYAGGYFLDVNGITARCVARWDGTAWHPLGGGGINGAAGMSLRVDSLAVHDDGSGPALYVGGLFSFAGWNLPARTIARWDGTSWSALGSGLASADGVATVETMCSFDDGSGPALYVAGIFETAGGLPVPSNMARWRNGTWEPVGEGVEFNRSLVVFDDGTGPALYAAGTPPSIGTPGVVKWNGSQWTSVGSSLGVPEALAIFDDGRGPSLYATGNFTLIAGLSVRRVTRWNGQFWEPMGGGISHRGYCLATHDDGTGAALYVAGHFVVAGANTSYRVSSWRACTPPVDTLCAGDGTLVACPCTPNGASGHGCRNSANPAGAVLSVSGVPEADDLVLHADQMPPSAPALYFQGDAQLVTSFGSGDGLRCAGGRVRRLFLDVAVAGSSAEPGPGEPSLRTRLAALGDALPPGSVRFYQVYYRDPSPTYCPAPTGNTWNLTNAVRIVW